MAVAQISSTLYVSTRDVCAISSSATPYRLPLPNFGRTTSSFITGSPLVLRKTCCQVKVGTKATPFSIRCEQSSQGSNSLDVWLGRIAMVSFTAAVSIEIATGKGLLENFGLTSPLPIAALAVTGLAGSLIALFIFQSASKN